MAPTFAELGVHPDLLKALAKQSIEEPTPIQAVAIPELLRGKSAYLQAETGTGKTLAYLLPLCSKIDLELANAQLIVVAPTHELAIQIQRECTNLSQQSGLPIRIVLLIGGTPRERQLDKLKKKPHVVIGSPGRIRELIEDGKLKTHHVRAIVVDEADRVLVSESFDDLRVMAKSTLRDRAFVFVSATERPEVAEAIVTLAPEVERIKAAARPVNSNIEHLYLVCEERDKPELVRKLIHAMRPERSMVFVHKNDTAQILASKLAHHKMRVADLHGSLDKHERKRAMDNMRSGEIDVLIASDVGARGLDIKGVTHVFNVDVPTESDAYLHRVGRTGRAGECGVALSLVCGPQERAVKRYEHELGILVKRVYLREGKVHLAEEVDRFKHPL
jgi:superfamily II DNA/RNA helicase